MAKRLLISLFALATCLLKTGAQTVVVADAETRQPVAHASLYTKDDGRFLSCISDLEGRATVNFSFRRLTVSHLNYERTVVRHLQDTLWLKPKYRSTAEVVVTNKEPEWIRRKLKATARQKGLHYFTCDDSMTFSYDTQSMGRNHIYRYHLTGLMRTKSTLHKHYALRADSSLIVASDSTRLTDTANLQRMLYEDFMLEFDNGFISSHKWGENPDFAGRSRDEVELLFRSKHRTDDRGRIVIDTTRCVILEASRQTGTRTNRHERMSAVLYAMARAMSGYRVNTWTRDYHVRYTERPDGTLYPAEVRYKTYIDTSDNEVTKEQQEFSEQTGGGFPNMEATLHLCPADTAAKAPAELTTEWLDLYPGWYLRLSSETERQRDIQMSNLPASFTIFNE